MTDYYTGIKGGREEAQEGRRTEIIKRDEEAKARCGSVCG